MTAMPIVLMNSDDAPTSVLIFDAHLAVREGIKAMLAESSLQVIGEAGALEDLLARAGTDPVGVYLLGFSSSGIADTGVLESIFARDPDANILVYAPDEAVDVISEIYELGAKGYVSKASDAATLTAGLHRVAAGEHFFMPGMAEQIALYHVAGTSLPDPRKVLNEAELKIFVQLAASKPISSIAESLGLTEKSVRNRAVTIRHKLGIRREEFTKHARTHKLL